MQIFAYVRVKIRQNRKEMFSSSTRACRQNNALASRTIRIHFAQHLPVYDDDGLAREWCRVSHQQLRSVDPAPIWHHVSVRLLLLLLGRPVSQVTIVSLTIFSAFHRGEIRETNLHHYLWTGRQFSPKGSAQIFNFPRGPAKITTAR